MLISYDAYDVLWWITIKNKYTHQGFYIDDRSTENIVILRDRLYSLYIGEKCNISIFLVITVSIDIWCVFEILFYEYNIMMIFLRILPGTTIKFIIKNSFCDP